MNKLRYTIRELGNFGLIVFLLFGFRSAIADWYEIPTGSMKPTIIESDRVFVNKLAYDLKIPFSRINIASWSTPERGEIIVFEAPEYSQRMIKRVVGLPGDIIQLKENVLFINGQPAQYQRYEQKQHAEYWTDDNTVRESYIEQFNNHPHLIAVQTQHHSVSNYGPVVVPDSSYFVLGDNRDDSMDSRYIGSIHRKNILGRAGSVFYSTRFIGRSFSGLDSP